MMPTSRHALTGVIADPARPDSAVVTDPARPVVAWFALVRLCIQRQARSHQMVWIALILLGFTTAVIAVQTAANRWGMDHWRMPRRVGPTFNQYLIQLQDVQHAWPWNPQVMMMNEGFLAAAQTTLAHSGFYVFANWVVYSVFLSFLLPIWSLSFATEALGGEREGGTLIWLLTRPMPRSTIYLAQFVALLPWALGLNLGGFAVLCLAAGPPGLMALTLFWPAVFVSTLAFSALFHLLSACFRRAAVVALVYCFFLETILGNMPGLMKRVSIGFYTRCIMFDAAYAQGVEPPKTTVFLPVDSSVAYGVLAAMTAGCLLVGMVVFARTQYQDLT